MPNIVTCGTCEVSLLSEDLENHTCSPNYRFEGNLLWIRSRGKWDICYYHPTMVRLGPKFLKQYYDPVLKSLSPVFFDNVENRRKLGMTGHKPTDPSQGEDPIDNVIECCNFVPRLEIFLSFADSSLV